MGIEDEFDEATVVTLGEGEALQVSSFEEAFGEYSNLFGKNKAQRQAARAQRKVAKQQNKAKKKVARQQKKQAKVAARAQTRAVKQQARTAKKVGRQQVRAAKKVARQNVKAQKRVAKQQAKQAKQVARQTRKTSKVAARQDRKDLRATRRQARRPEPQNEEEYYDESTLLDDPYAEQGADELENGYYPEEEGQDYAEQSNPYADEDQYYDTEAAADEAEGIEEYAEDPYYEDEDYEDEDGYAEDEDGYAEDDGDYYDEEEWEPEYYFDGSVDETQFGFNSDMDEASGFDASVRQPNPALQDNVNRIERNRFKIGMLQKRMNSNEPGDHLAMQREVDKRKGRIQELLEKVKGYFSEARGWRKAGGINAAKAEVIAARKIAKRNIAQAMQAQRAAARPAGGPSGRPAPGMSRSRAMASPVPQTTPVAEALDPSIGRNSIDIPAETGEVAPGFDGSGTGSKPTGMVAKDEACDYDAPKATVLEIQSNAAGNANFSVGKVATTLALIGLSLWGASKAGLFNK